MKWREILQLLTIINDALYIGTSANDLEMELQNNTWLISMSLEERLYLSTEDLLDFFECVIKDREAQIIDTSSSHGMYFYIWHDRQASQLRFSLISDFHEVLPFSSEIIESDLNTIISEFLRSEDHIPRSELKVSDAMQENMADDFVDGVKLPVFQKHLRQNDD